MNDVDTRDPLTIIVRDALRRDAERAPQLPAEWSGPDIVSVSPIESRRPSRFTAAVGVAAAVVVVATLAVIVPSWRDAEPSERDVVDQPTTTPVPPSTTPKAIGEVIGEVDASLLPELYPAFAVGDPRNDTASGDYSQNIYDQALFAEALVARADGDVFVDAVGIIAFADIGDFDFARLGAHTTETLTNGSTVDVYTRPGTPPTITVLLPTRPVAVTGADPLTFVDAIDDLSVVEPAVGRADDASSVVDFSLDEPGSLEPLHVVVPLPPGYVTIFEPHTLEPGSLVATFVSGSEAAADTVVVYVQLDRPLNGSNAVGRLRRVDVNGTTAWLQEGNGTRVSWQVGERTWVTLFGATTADAALDAARSLEFVDQATWHDRYPIQGPSFDVPPSNELDESATTNPLTANETVPFAVD